MTKNQRSTAIEVLGEAERLRVLVAKLLAAPTVVTPTALACARGIVARLEALDQANSSTKSRA